jgi:hypothetical protein
MRLRQNLKRCPPPCPLTASAGILQAHRIGREGSDVRIASGVPCRYVTGYRNSNAARLALQRNKISVHAETTRAYFAVVEPSMVKTGQVLPVRSGTTRATTASASMCRRSWKASRSRRSTTFIAR